MDLREKENRLDYWLTYFPWLESEHYVLRSMLKYTKDVDALCLSIVRDWCIKKYWNDVLDLKAEMAPALDNMYKHIDLVLEDKNDGCMYAVDTKYLKRSRNDRLWYEVEKNSKSSASKLMYVLNDGYCAIIDREAANEALKFKRRYASSYGEVLCYFMLADIPAEHIEVVSFDGVFKPLENVLARK